MNKRTKKPLMQYHSLMRKGLDTRWNILAKLGKDLAPRVSSSTVWNWVKSSPKRIEIRTTAVLNNTNNVVRRHTFLESVNIRTLDGNKVCLTFEDIERISKLAGTNC